MLRAKKDHHMYGDLTSIWKDPKREADADRYHRALLAAMNATHDHGSQDAMAVLEGFSRLLAQIVAADPRVTEGAIRYVETRTRELAPQASALGIAPNLAVEH